MKKGKMLFAVFANVLAAVFLFAFAAGCTPQNPSGGGGTYFPPDDDDPYVTELKITTPPTKLEYYPEEFFEPDGMKLTAVWSHGEEEELLPQECTITPATDVPLTTSTKEIAFTYEGATAKQAITVTEIEFTGIRVDSSMIPTQQVAGTIDLTQIKVYLVHARGEIETRHYELWEGESKIEHPEEYELENGQHTITVKPVDDYSDVPSTTFTIYGFAGYTADAANIVYTEVLEANREDWIGTNFLENPMPNAARYDSADPETRRQVTLGGYNNGLGKPMYNSAGSVSNSHTNYIVSWDRDFTLLGDGILDPANIPSEAYVGDVKKNDIMRFHIWSDLAQSVELVFHAASGYMTADWGGWKPKTMGDMQFNKLFNVSRVAVDPATNLPQKDGGTEVKTPITVDDAVILPGGSSSNAEEGALLWSNFVGVSFGEVELQEGDNIFEFVCISDYKNCLGFGCAANIDGFEVRFLEDCDEHHIVPVKGDPQPTCEAAGVKDYFQCDKCGRRFVDEEGETRLYNDVVAPALGHDMTKKGYDSTSHYTECAHGCGKRSEELPHSLYYVNDDPETGEQIWKCRGCEYEERREATGCKHELNKIVATPVRENWYVGETFGKEQVTVIKTCEDGVKQEPATEEFTLEGADGATDSIGEHEITVKYTDSSYGELTDTFTIYVVGEKIQVEDETRVEFYEKDGTTKKSLKGSTDNWQNYAFLHAASDKDNIISNGAEGDVISGLEDSFIGRTIRFHVNVDTEGTYRLMARGITTVQGGNVTTSMGGLSYSVNPEGEYSTWKFNTCVGTSQKSTGYGKWTRMLNWSIVEIAEIELNAGDNFIVLRVDSQVPNIDWFAVENTEYESPYDVAHAEILSFRDKGFEFTQNETGAHPEYSFNADFQDSSSGFGLFEDLYMRVKVPEGKGTKYYDVFIGCDILKDSGFSTEELGEHTITVTVNVFDETFSVEMTYNVAAE